MQLQAKREVALGSGRPMIEEHSAQGTAAKAAAAMSELHRASPLYAEGIATFLADPPAFGSMKITVQHGDVCGVELTRTLPRA
jgi:hypothetical protein